MVEITLNKMELRLAKALHEQRLAENKKRGIRDRQIGDDPPTFDGVAAEVAFCKLFNVYPDLNTEHWDQADVTVGGYTYDIKQSKYASAHLLVAEWKAKKQDRVDFFAMMIGQAPTYKYVGLISSRDLMIPERLKGPNPLSFPKVRSYVATQDDLVVEVY